MSPGRLPPATRRVFTLPLRARILWILAMIVLTVGTGGMAVLAAILLGGAAQWAVGLTIAACAVLMAAVSGYCLRDVRAKLGLRVILDADAVRLDLPAGRSLIHRPPALHAAVPYADIAAIDARFEGYRSLGLAMVQRAYVLHKKSGELVFLFEERALATRMTSGFYADIVAALAARAHVAVRELGTVEGKGGAFCVWGTHAPDWAAPPLPRDQVLRLWRHAAATGSVVFSLILFMSILRALR